MLRASKRWRLRSETIEHKWQEPADESTIIVDLSCKLNEIHTITRENTRVLLLGTVIIEFRAIGEAKQHLKLTIRQEEITMDCIGYDLGFLIHDITPLAHVNLVVEPIVREWNGIPKTQLIIEDIEIPEMQIFDFRETQDKASKLLYSANREALIICFREGSVGELQSHESENSVGICYINEDLYVQVIRHNDSSLYSEIILYDTPYSLLQLNKGLSLVPKPERIYCLFGDEYKDRLAVLPKRDQFKWLYSIFLKHKRLAASLLPQLAKSGKVSEHTVYFMLCVFVELGFIQDSGGTYLLEPSPVHRDIQESKLYQRKRSEMELETEILYSSYAILCNAIKQVTL